MSWTITPQTKVPVDPIYNNVSLLLHGNQSAGQFIDSSPSPKSITKVGNVAPSSPGGGTPIYPSSNSAFGSAIAFDGNGDYLTIPSNTAFQFDTGDFTIEFWVYVLSVKAGINFVNTNTGAGPTTNSIVVGLGASNALEYYINGSSRILDPAPLGLNAWSHVALSRNSGTSRMFKNGTQVGASFADTQTVSSTRAFLIGTRDDNLNYSFDGYIDDLRITKGVARYTSNFSVPAAPFPDI